MRRIAIVAIFVLAAMGIRSWVSWHIYVVAADAAGGYLYQAREILRGNWTAGIGTYFPPGYPLLISGASIIVGDVETAGRLISIMSGGLLIAVLYTMAAEFYGSRTGWVACAFGVTYPVLVEHSSDAVSEGIYTLVLMLATWAGCRFLRSPSGWKGFGLGILFGLCYLIRAEALFFMLLLVLFSSIRCRISATDGERLSEYRVGLVAPVTICIGFALCALPYVSFLRLQSGTWSMSGKIMENLLSYDITPQGDPVDLEQVRASLSADGRHLEMEAARQRSVVGFLWKNRWRECEKYGANLVKIYLNILPRTIYPLFLVLVGMGLFCKKRELARWEDTYYLAAVFGLPFALYPLFLVEVRYFAPVVPIALCWAGRGAVCAAEGLVSWTAKCLRRERVLLGTIVGAVIILHVWPIVKITSMDPWSYALEHRQAGEWLRVNGRPHARIMNRKAYVAYYAAGIPFLTPYADYTEVVEYARAQAIDYLVVDERYTASTRPGLEALGYGRQCPGELKVVYADNKGPGRGIVVYSLGGDNGISQAPGRDRKE